jgi:hypothetical protein
MPAAHREGRQHAGEQHRPAGENADQPGRTGIF